MYLREDLSAYGLGTAQHSNRQNVYDQWMIFKTLLMYISTVSVVKYGAPLNHAKRLFEKI